MSDRSVCESAEVIQSAEATMVVKKRKAPRYGPDEAVIRLQPYFGRVAKEFSGGKWDLRDDLKQEMSLAVLNCKGRHTLSFFRARARDRAMDLLRKEGVHAENRESEELLQGRAAHEVLSGIEKEERRLAARAKLIRHEFGFLLADCEKLVG